MLRNVEVVTRDLKYDAIEVLESLIEMSQSFPNKTNESSTNPQKKKTTSVM